VTQTPFVHLPVAQYVPAPEHVPQPLLDVIAVPQSTLLALGQLAPIPAFEHDALAVPALLHVSVVHVLPSSHSWSELHAMLVGTHARFEHTSFAEHVANRQTPAKPSSFMHDVIAPLQGCGLAHMLLHRSSA